MSRVGKKPVALPDGVKVNINPDAIEVEGPKGKLVSPVPEGIDVKLEDNHLVFKRKAETKQLMAFHGLARSLAHNAVVGVSQGFTRKLEIVGVGYRAKLEKNNLELNLGYSKPVVFPVPEDIEVELEKPTLISIKGIDKQRVGQVARKIRDLRKPDPYKLKGIRFVGERLIKKERKAGVGGA
ncbi:MAG: 50S ribosomal protein L6 [Candidatus Aminicenantes bacterium]|nr:50S ribosomal protein L6 [Candidatus Aminicenantes bacterium]